jgi:hypothetical protein
MVLTEWLWFDRDPISRGVIDDLRKHACDS